ncbi:DNA-binding MarR family transcriptional regulator [Friedmanniella endophytica]|uniref:DNA-binding MarR family transcriptional regulator n=1 Tax=Microlunatus kandeliicorticis TaxID=1759536 RepID=A0A7W3ISR9_9ACTN|nr:MarR family transcriptional regulator [Microlunatus kandeliicorticis]MBA8794588.1 DNA-binding MarR family transcriptional regulator [Microlunatus kandeliicorticis]
MAGSAARTSTSASTSAPASSSRATDAEPGAQARDEVDSLVDAWQRERPELDVSPMHVLSRVTRLARHLDRARRDAFAAHELESWEFDVLAALRRAGAPYRLSPGQLLRETMVTSGTMTNRVDRLSARGLVTRTDHPEDRRGVLVGLTPTGRAAVDAAMDDLLAAEHAILDDLDRAELDALAGTLRRLTVAYEG